jgi:predicted transcriptional regulator
MKMHTQLGDLQLRILRRLWSMGEATVTEVQEALEDERPLAPTTVATMLKKMEHKGVVAHRVDGRRFIYRAAVSEDAVTRSMVGHLMESLFDGQAKALVSHLIHSHEISPRELGELQQMIAAAEKKERSK